jgi:5-methylcytosine-specific restriction enzyme B
VPAEFSHIRLRSRLAKRFRLLHLSVGEGDGFSDLVQFHPAYAYEDFIEGIRPERALDGGGLDYPVRSGRFLRFCREAERRTGLCVLIIDEINRANLSRVFGELMYLLEYRRERVRLAVSGQLFAIPANVRILGTMNTADRSIALVDHALRRRFAFIGLDPRYEVLASWHASHGTGFDPSGLVEVLRRLNSTIEDSNYSVGISFFLVSEPVTTLPSVWRMEIEPYLEEYFFDQRETVARFRWDRIRDEVLRT